MKAEEKIRGSKIFNHDQYDKLQCEGIRRSSKEKGNSDDSANSQTKIVLHSRDEDGKYKEELVYMDVGKTECDYLFKLSNEKSDGILIIWDNKESV